MASISRHIHPQANFFWKPLREVAPDLQLQPAPNAGNGQPPAEPMALVMVDPDMETHVYVFDDQGKQRFLAALTGGIEIPRPGHPVL